ncbi:hypothetical protein PACTADRAFT_50539 [Pachysolen tannophilus NRRL Y-2460]|uniref:mRNA cap guanine-N(7) methyltransferase n=1 Tax=Pachysolen tannophilus NRRL Y-2460 TaxID=669874 RepID=A0A1E4TSG1_PACTA|nr:hypothetical protein PACTADRAFT_50539 [Pachysolen tannophilus NRRL Y-2460]
MSNEGGENEVLADNGKPEDSIAMKTEVEKVEKVETKAGTTTASELSKPRRRMLIKGTKDSLYEEYSLRNRDEERKKNHMKRANNEEALMGRRRDDLDINNEKNDEKEELPKAPTTAVGAAPNKPAWMKDDEFAKFSQRVEATTTTNNEGRKLKKRKGRGNLEDQLKEAELIRQREDLKEQKMIESNLKRVQAINSGELEVDDIVKQHYNQRTHLARRENRRTSPIIKLRNFNNCIKYILINKFGKANDSVIDLGCGKGGDLQKWALANVSTYIGLDISSDSITEAIRRYKTISTRNQANFQSFFITADCFGNSITEILAPFPEITTLMPVDICSMQFCMHYGFRSEEIVRTMLSNVSKSLKIGGHFIGTIPSSDFIADKIKNLPQGETKWGNSIYSVDFEHPPPKDGYFTQPYGNMYTYFLKDAVDNVPEYVVPFEAFRSIAEEYDLSLRYKKNFGDLFKEEIPNYFYKLNRRLLEGIRRSDGTYGIEGDEYEASCFYLAFAFERVGYQ